MELNIRCSISIHPGSSFCADRHASYVQQHSKEDVNQGLQQRYVLCLRSTRLLLWTQAAQMVVQKGSGVEQRDKQCCLFRTDPGWNIQLACRLVGRALVNGARETRDEARGCCAGAW
jgi:hypothetical protein